jgi:hypothetical protein|tara:strand:+ start:911 stop:2224 length:1314 start_codon:yes stop_codon:yes gene_type:complete
MSIASLSYDVQSQPPIGLATLEHASKILSDFGRNGDTYVVHAKEGETVIPMEVLDNNPKLKDMLFKQMRELDLDPYRYIVGNELNSINPDTGQPEFFLKKLFKGLKKVVKKVAPIVLPIAAPFLLPAMPLFLSTGIGTLAGGLIGGQKPKDALRNAVISGGLAGLGNMAMGSGGFGGSAIDAGITKGDYDITKMFGGESAPPVKTSANQFIPDESVVYRKPEDGGILSTLKKGASDIGDSVTNVYDTYLKPSRESIMPSNDAIMKSAKETAQGQYKTFEDLGVKLSADKKQDILIDALKTAKKDLAPSAFSKYAPLGGLTALGLYGLDKAGLPIFTVPEEEMGAPPPTGLDLLNMDPDRFKFTNFYGKNPYYQNRVSAADGGEIVGPGTSTSDSIPAMLSDGEFVMNARAVQGAGGGDRKAGAKRMYQMMKKFEKVA